MIYRITQIPEAELPNVGGKARGLYQLSACGLNVPDGFIVTDAGADTAADDAAEYYEKMGLGKVAVRSSATAEDGEDFSSAGQYSTYLNVEGAEAVRQAVRDCAASLAWLRPARGKTAGPPARQRAPSTRSARPMRSARPARSVLGRRAGKSELCPPGPVERRTPRPAALPYRRAMRRPPRRRPRRRRPNGAPAAPGAPAALSRCRR